MIQSHNLSKDDLALIKLIFEEKTNIQIGTILNYSEAAAKKRINQIYKLMKVKGRIGLIKKVYELNLLKEA